MTDKRRRDTRRTKRRPSLERMLEQAHKGGEKVRGARVYPDYIELTFGKPESVEPDNSWPLDEFRTKETKQ
jgi:hypothetical protein